MDASENARVIAELRELLLTRYLDRAVASRLDEVLAQGLADGRYTGLDHASLAAAVTPDLQSVNGDQHLRLNHQDEPLAERAPGDDTEEYAAMARWAASTSHGIARVERLEPNIGLVAIAPVLFPVAISGPAVTNAMSLVASCEALVIDVRGCLGGDPDQVAWLCSYLFDEPVELSALDEPSRSAPKQSWTLAHVPGARYGGTKPVYVVTSATTFSGGEQLSYDLQASGRATVVGEQTRGGAHAREGFRLSAHLEATISVARAVNPVTGSNWEGTGVTPDISAAAADALETAVGRARAEAG